MDNLIFKLDLIDFNRLFKISGLTGNSLSTFKYDINILDETEVSDAFEELIKSKIINEFSEIILLSTIVSKYSLKAIALNPDSEKMSPTFIVTSLPSILISILLRLLDQIQIAK